MTARIFGAGVAGTADAFGGFNLIGPGGLLIGNGEDADPLTCGTSCDGGRGGLLLGNGGKGANGGRGGDAGFIGNGGAGGDAVEPLR